MCHIIWHILYGKEIKITNVSEISKFQKPKKKEFLMINSVSIEQIDMELYICW